jgi:hypothetical protein
MYKLSTYLVLTYFPTYLPIGDLFPTESVTKVKPKINPMEVHPQLSNHGHPVYGALVGAGHFGPSTVLVHFVSVMKATSPSDLFLANFSILSSEKYYFDR